MLSRLTPLCTSYGTRCFSSTAFAWKDHSCKLLVVGGGAGGCSIAAKFAPKLGKNKVIIVEPADRHYYQPMFTLIGGGMKDLDDSYKPMKEVLPSDAEWIKDSAVHVDPHASEVHTKGGHVISYDFLVLAPGIYLDFKAVPGLQEGLEDPKSGVCTNYLPNFTNKTFKCIKKLEKGNAVFTYPNSQVKCAGAPQKIAYITSDYLQLNNIKKPQIIYTTALPVIFKAPKYAESLWKVAKSRNVDVMLKMDLKEVQHENKRALFENVEKPSDSRVIEYEMLHVCPPQRPPDVIANNADLADATGFLDVDKRTLRHTRFPNIFGIGDCTNLPTSKTAAAVAGQLGVLRSNLKSAMKGEEPTMSYDGYTSCPLVTGYSTCILAEFDYDAQPLETFPFDQGVERKTMFHLKKDVMPQVYFQLMLRGLWEGPAMMRKALHFGMSK